MDRFGDAAIRRSGGGRLGGEEAGRLGGGEMDRCRDGDDGMLGVMEGGGTILTLPRERVMSLPSYTHYIALRSGYV